MFLTEEQQKLFDDNEKLMYYFANQLNKRYFNFSYEELLSFAGHGLMKAARGFKPESGYKFASFAGTCIENEVRMALRSIKKHNEKVSCSLDDTFTTSNGESMTLGDTFEAKGYDVEDTFEVTEQFESLYTYLDTVTEVERTIFLHTYALKGYEEKNQRELSEMLNLSQSYISRLCNRTREGFAHYYNSGEIDKRRTKDKAVKEQEVTQTPEPSPIVDKKRGDVAKSSKYACKDHLGNEYPNIGEMCRHYGVREANFYYHRSKGRSLEVCLGLSKHIENSKYIDHLGKSFSSIEDMVKHHNVTVATFYYRKKKGKSLAECLGYIDFVPNGVTDHLGAKFATIEDMLKHHGITTGTFYYRKSRGKSLAECLGYYGDDCVKDHLGNKFGSLNLMIKHYGVSSATFYKRKKKGDSLELCLMSTKDYNAKLKDIAVLVKEIANSKSTIENVEDTSVTVATEVKTHTILDVVYMDTYAKIRYLDNCSRTVITIPVGYREKLWYSSDGTSSKPYLKMRGTTLEGVYV